MITSRQLWRVKYQKYEPDKTAHKNFNCRGPFHHHLPETFHMWAKHVLRNSFRCKHRAHTIGIGWEHNNNPSRPTNVCIFQNNGYIKNKLYKKWKSNDMLKQVLLLIMLLGAGLVSPSNGEDDKGDKLPLQMLFETFIIILAVLSIYFLHRQGRFRRYFLKKRLKTFWGYKSRGHWQRKWFELAT